MHAGLKIGEIAFNNSWIWKKWQVRRDLDDVQESTSVRTAISELS
jgi:hypothetical protein